MAQNITLQGASYTDVPAVNLPKTGGGIATFADPTITTAVAADVAQGKQFLLADGSIGTGTASGGGSFIPVLGVIRPDAELVRRWTYDRKYVEDLGNTLPSYSTSAKTLVSSSNEGVTVAHDNYTYFVCYRALTIPIYNSETSVSGREEYHFSFLAGEGIHLPSTAIKAFNGRVYGSVLDLSFTPSIQSRYVYWSSTTAIKTTTSVYGAYSSGSSPSFGATKITVYFPSFSLKGHATYFPQAAWDMLTDIRMQYVAELYRVPRSSETDKDGWWGNTQIRHILNCVDNGGTLT